MRRASAFVRAAAVATAERIEDVEGGLALFCDRLPDVWDLNFVWLDEVPADATAESLAAQADALQGRAGLDHRHIVVADQEAGARIAREFSALGWSASTLLHMEHRRPPDRPRHADVRELDEPGQRPFRERLLREAPERYDDDVVRQLLEAVHVGSAAVPTRWFAAYAEEEPASVCELYAVGSTSQIEDLNTLEQYRSRGLASAVFLHAVEQAHAAGAEFLFILAEEDDWPWRLYERLGFDPIGRTYAVLRKPDGLSAGTADAVATCHVVSVEASGPDEPPRPPSASAARASPLPAQESLSSSSAAELMQ